MSHYAFNGFALPPIITALCSLVVGLRVLRREWTSRVGEALFLGTATISIWLAASALMYLAADPSTAFFWAHVVYIAVPLLPAAIYLYATVGLRHYQSEKVFVWTLILAAFAFTGLAYASHLLLSGVEKHWLGYCPTYGPAGPVFVGYLAFVIVLGVIKLRSRLRETPKGSLFHRRIAMSCLAVAVVSVAAVDFLAEFGVPVYPFGYVAVLAFLAVILVLEKRHRIVYMAPAFAAGQILATMQGAVLVTTLEGAVEVGNHAAGELLGYSETEFLELSLDKVFRSETEWRSLLHDCLTGEEVRDRETFWRPRNGGAVDVSVSASLLTDGKDQPLGVVFAALDITSRKQAEEALRLSEEKLRQSQKMEAVGQLAGGVAHDFNNLMTAVLGYTELILAREEIAGSDIQDDLLEIKRAAERASSLTGQILAFSRRQVLRPEVVQLNEIVLGMEPLLRRTLGEDVDLSLSLAPDLMNTQVDPHQIEQVLVNLALNSRDAMPSGGSLTVETGNVKLEPSYCLTHPGVEPGYYVMLAVSDSGLGMDEETESHVFEPFFTTKEVGKGTGLGLSIVYGIVAQSGGCISVHSELGKGTTFEVYLCATGAGAGQATAPPAQGATRGGSETILLVEDEVSVRELAFRVLSRAGYRVVQAGSMRGVDAALEQAEGTLDLLLTDVVLPGGANGRDVAETLLQRHQGLRVVFMSGYDRDSVVHNGRLDEGVELLEKPFSAEKLLRKVRAVLDAPEAPPAR
jgi:PAS domain S-box-containing protein